MHPAGRPRTPAPARNNVYIHLISDATGTAAERMARAALVQFHRQFNSIFIRHPFIKSAKRLNAILDEAESQNGVVIYTMNDRSLRQHLARQEAKRDLVIIDMLGPLFEKVGKRYKSRPLLSSGLLPNALGEKSLRLAEAIDFTLRHDDGKLLETLGQSEVILVGVSRTSKTPTSLYLSCHYGLKVANVPIILGVEPPAKLFTLKRPKMVGLTISPQKLASIRRGRFHKKVLDGYSDARTIASELAYSEEVFERIKGIQVIDVTDRPIEEVANIIVQP